MDDKNKKILKEYIVSQRERGVSDTDIENVLIDAGWNEEDVIIGFNELDGALSFIESKNESKTEEVFSNEELEEKEDSKEEDVSNKEKSEPIDNENFKEEKQDTKKESNYKLKESEKNNAVNSIKESYSQRPYKNLNVIKNTDLPPKKKEEVLGSGADESFFKVALVVVTTLIIMSFLSVGSYYLLKNFYEDEGGISGNVITDNLIF